MTAYVDRFYAASTKQAGNPANVYDLLETVPAAATGATLTWSATAVSTRRVVPFTNQTSSTAEPAANAAASGNGWRLRTVDVDAASGEPRVVVAGSTSVVCSLTTGSYALLAASPSYRLMGILYKLSAAGVSTEVGRATSTLTVAATTTQTFTATFAHAVITLQPGETLQVEMYVTGAATANVLGTVTNNVCTVDLGAVTGLDLASPLRTVATRSAADSSPAATDSAVRSQVDVRRTTDAAVVPDASTTRTTTGVRVAADSTSSTDLAVSTETYPRGASETSPATTDVAARTQTNYRRVPDAVSLLQADASRRTVDFRRAVEQLDVALASALKLVTYGRSVRHQFAPGDDPLVDPTRWITGVVRLPNNAAYLGGATVYLVRNDDVVVASTTSSEVDGSYVFARNSFDSATYYVVAFTDGALPREGVTERGLVPV